MNCPKCSTPIRGEYHVEGVIGFGDTPPPPAFCHECGQSYPWTERRRQAAKELADTLDELTPEEREKLKENIDDITVESAKTEMAASRFKRFMAKLGEESRSAFKRILVDVLSETAKRIVLGP